MSSTATSLPSASISTQSDQEPRLIDPDGPCLVYWEHCQPLGLLNQVKSVSRSASQPADQPLPKTPSKRATNQSLSKRNSTAAGIPSPSKPQKVLPEQHTRRALRCSKRRKDKPPPDQSERNHESPPALPAHKTRATPLPSKQRDALNALASRISLRKKQDSISPITSKPNIDSHQSPSISIKGKQPDRSNQNQNISQFAPYLVSDPRDCSYLSAPSLPKTSLIPGRIIPGSSSKPTQPDYPQTHYSQVSSPKFNQFNQKLVCQKPQRLVHFSNQYQPRDESKLRHSTKPTPTPQEIEKTIPIKSNPQKHAVESPSEPWDVEEDDEFGSQLLELVDLVEKEQQDSASNPELYQVKIASNSKGTKILARESSTNFHKDKAASSRLAVSSGVQNKLSPKTKIQQPLANSFAKKETYSRPAHVKGQPPITSAYKTALLVSKPTIPNPKHAAKNGSELNKPPTPNHNGLNKQSAAYGKIPVGPEAKKAGATKTATNQQNLNTSTNASKITSSKMTNTLHATAKKSYSNALTGNQVGSKIDDNATYNSLNPKPINPTTRIDVVNQPQKSMDINLLFSGLVGEDLDWDPNE